MRTRRLLVLTTAVVLASCSGDSMSTDETLTEDEYFAKLDRIAQDADDSFAQWEQETSDALEGVGSSEEATDIFLPLLEEASALVQTTLVQLQEFSPPDEVTDAHEAFVKSIQANLAAFQGLVDNYDELGFEGTVAAVLGEEIQSLEQEQDAACADLQAIADDSGVDVDLGCGE